MEKSKYNGIHKVISTLYKAIIKIRFNNNYQPILLVAKRSLYSHSLWIVFVGSRPMQKSYLFLKYKFNYTHNIY